LNKFRSELVGLRTSKVSSAPQVKLARIRVVRKAIAKVLTVLHEKRRDAAKGEYKNKKYTPRDLRAKSSKAYRNKMTKHSQGLVTQKEAKKAGNFRQRRFAVVKA
jgi:large subunit ribosomal protein L35e